MIQSLTLPLVCYAPRFTAEAVAAIVEKLYGLRVTATSLPSERDQNFLLLDDRQHKFVLKIANLLEDEALLQAETDAIAHLGKQLGFFPRIVASRHGKLLEKVSGETGEVYLIRLATYLSGMPLAETNRLDVALLHDLGRRIGEMDRVLLEFDRPSIHRDFHWDLAKWQTVTAENAKLIREDKLRALVLTYCDSFDRHTAPLLDNLRRSCIHGDTNDYNILVNGSKVVGIIDFGDMVYSYTVADLAIGLAYVLLSSDQPLPSAVFVTDGYHKMLPLSEHEIDVLWSLAIMRLCMSVCLAAFQQQQQPDNKYLNISQRAIGQRLPELIGIDEKAFRSELVL